MEHQESYKVSRDGQVIGTYSEDDVLKGLASRELLQTDHYWRQGMEQWACLSGFVPSKTPGQPSVGNRLIGATATAALLIVLIVTFAGNGTSREAPAQRNSTATEQATTKQQDKLVALNGTLKATEDRIAVLLKKFLAQEDKFQKLTWFTHNNEDALLTKLFRGDKNCVLLVRVNSLGGRYLTSIYSGKSWIFHTQVEFRIEDDVHKTERVQSKDNDRTITGSKVLETCNYMSDENRRLCSVLALAAERGAQIHYRLSGDHDNLERLAPDEEAEAIRDSVALADALAERERIKRELASAEAGR